MKNRILDKVVIIDLEATCWEKGKQPEGVFNEIIEIGVCTLDLTSFQVENPKSIIVKPVKSTVSEYCTKLTTLTQEYVDTNGILFKDACALLESEYGTRQRTWASWGDYDRIQFERQCRLDKLQYPMDIRHLNVKSMFSVFRGMSKEVGLGKAMDLLGNKFMGTPHRGVDDAQNIAWILGELIKKFRGQ